MVLILLSWLYIVFTTVNLGFLIDKLLKTNVKDFIVITVFGLFGVTILAGTWAIFGRINWEFHAFLLLLNTLIFFRYKTDIVGIYKNLYTSLQQLQTSLKILLGIITVLIIAQCSTAPYVIDNETYYIQTIKWLNQYGLVKGLGNLHLFLAQTSAWHITQSAFSFSFLYKNFNDLSGFCLLLGNLFAINKLNNYFTNHNKLYLVMGLLPIANLFMFQFVSAPSPDIPVYVLSFIIIFYFSKQYKHVNIEAFTTLSLLAVFCIFIKTTSVSIIVLPIIIIVKHYSYLILKIWKIAVVSVLVLVLFLIKNTIVSGHPFFPIMSDAFHTDYAIPPAIINLHNTQAKTYSYFVSDGNYQSMSVTQLFIRWLTLSKLNGLLNKLAVLLIVICPVLIYRFCNKKTFWTLYFAMCLQMAVLFCTSPQYRFFFNFLLFFSLFIVAIIFHKKQNAIITLLYISTFITAFVLINPVDLNKFSNKKFVIPLSRFNVENIAFPHSNTKFNTGFTLRKQGNLEYYSPVENPSLRYLGDGPLPCVNYDAIEYNRTQFGIVPQLRSTDLKDGFYPAFVNPD